VKYLYVPSLDRLFSSQTITLRLALVLAFWTRVIKQLCTLQ